VYVTVCPTRTADGPVTLMIELRPWETRRSTYSSRGVGVLTVVASVADAVIENRREVSNALDVLVTVAV